MPIRPLIWDGGRLREARPGEYNAFDDEAAGKVGRLTVTQETDLDNIRDRNWRMGYDSSRTSGKWAKVCTAYITESRQSYEIHICGSYTSAANDVVVTLAGVRGSPSASVINAYDKNALGERQFSKIAYLAGDTDDSGGNPVTIFIKIEGNYKDLDASVVIGKKFTIYKEELLSDLPDGAVEVDITSVYTSGSFPSADYATAGQGAKADSATQPGDLSKVATTGSYDDLDHKPSIPSQPSDIKAATAAQGAKADTAIQSASSKSAGLGVSKSGVSLSVTLSAATPSTQGAMSAADKTKVNYLNVSAATDLDQIRNRVDFLDASIVLVGTWSASSGSFPSDAAAGDSRGGVQAGYSYMVSHEGTVDGVDFQPGDRLLALVDSPSTKTYDGNWMKQDYTDRVSSVAGRTGDVRIAYGDVSGLGSAATYAHTDFATAAQGRTADSALQDAPSDDDSYARMGASWQKLAAVSTSGNYSDLKGQPSIPQSAPDIGAARVVGDFEPSDRTYPDAKKGDMFRAARDGRLQPESARFNPDIKKNDLLIALVDNPDREGGIGDDWLLVSYADVREAPGDGYYYIRGRSGWFQAEAHCSGNYGQLDKRYAPPKRPYFTGRYTDQSSVSGISYLSIKVTDSANGISLDKNGYVTIPESGFYLVTASAGFIDVEGINAESTVVVRPTLRSSSNSYIRALAREETYPGPKNTSTTSTTLTYLAKGQLVALAVGSYGTSSCTVDGTSDAYPCALSVIKVSDT